MARHERSSSTEQQGLLSSRDTLDEAYGSFDARIDSHSIDTSRNDEPNSPSSTYKTPPLQLTDIDTAHQRDASLEVSVTSSDEQPVGPDQFVKGFETSKWEVWAYYLYYCGNNALTLAYFAPALFQTLLAQAAGESGVLRFGGRDRTVNSIVLLSNGISFSIQVVVFTILGSFADFGSGRPKILIVLSIIGIGIGFGWLGIYTPDRWEIGAGLYILGLIAFQTSCAYFVAAFPALARNTPGLRQKAEDYNAGVISRDQYDLADSMERNRICNMALWVSGIGGSLILIGMIGILYVVDTDASPEQNNWGLALVIAWGSAAWLVLALPWFFLEKRRPGQPIPPGMNVISAGLWQIYRAGRQIWKLKQSLAYLVGFFFLGDSLNTSVALTLTLQNAAAGYNIIRISELILVEYVAQTICLIAYWRLQQRYGISTKSMLVFVAVCIIIMDIWGLIGAWTPNFGYHHVWEFWVWGFWYGGLVGPWYSYSQTMISEVTPRGKEFLFFSLFNVVGKASSFLGPVISSAIIDASPTHDNSAPFYFLTAISAISLVIIVFFVDLAKSRKEQEIFLEDERMARKGIEDGFRQKSS